MKIFIYTLIALSVFMFSGCQDRKDKSAINQFQSFIKSKEEYEDLSLVRIEYPRSARAVKHSKEADLGPEWEYALMGKVKRHADLRILVEAIYRMDLQSKISIEVQVEEKINWEEKGRSASKKGDGVGPGVLEIIYLL